LLKSRDLPDKPGVYLFKSGSKILYIGKAKNLQNRIRQYYQKIDQIQIKNLLNQADDLDTIITENENDALLLEYNLIQSYLPPFNIRLKDDKSFPYIEISTMDKFPGIYYSRNISPLNFHVGPITNSKKAKQLIDMITEIFKIRICSNNVFKRGTPCLYFYIERCSAPCINNISPSEYKKNVASAIDLLKGKKKKILDRLQHKMTDLSGKLKFEEAQKTKIGIDLLKDFILKSYITTPNRQNLDVIAMELIDEACFMALLSVVKGRVKGRDFYNFKTLSTVMADALKEFLLSFYQAKNIPNEIVLSFYPTDKESIKNLLTKMSGKRVNFHIPKRGIKKKILSLAHHNLTVYINRNSYGDIAKKLKSVLRLKRIPYWIEGFDVSHFSERDRVGAAITFINGKFKRDKYRSYLIKKALPGDINALKEMLERRFKNKRDNPDLLIIDGGITQLLAAVEIKNKFNLNSDIVSIAKGEERIFLESKQSVILPEDSLALFLLQNIRDEVHRRAISHHRKRRQKLSSKSNKDNA
jgi:excinuclease ABC subunit C